jgi:prophage tail gpP-like protein
VTDAKDKGPEDGTAANMDPEGDQVVSGEDKEKAATATDGVKKEGAKHHSREASRERKGRHRSAGSSHYSHHSRSPNSQRHVSHHHGSPSRKPGVLTFAQIRVSSDTSCSLFIM